MKTDTHIRNILFPTDFSPLAENALVAAIAMCKRHSAHLRVLHIIENGFLVVPIEAHNSMTYLLPELEKSGSDRLNQLLTEIKASHAIEVTTYLEFGNPAERIASQAMLLDCDLIVMGTHGASGFREFFMGSNAYGVVKNTGIPVLTIPGQKKIKDFKRILFPIRSKKGIIYKYDFIEPIIEKNNAKLIIAGLSLVGERDKLEPLNEEIIELGKALRLNHIAFESENFVCHNYAKKVLELSKKEKVDLIVINASFEQDWKQFFIGPYVQQVLHHAKVPVLSIRSFYNASVLAEAQTGDVQAMQQSLALPL